MTATRAAALNIHTALTLDERDGIDNAKGRALRLLALVDHVLNNRGYVADEEVDDAALLDVLDIIREDLTLITATFGRADRRHKTGGAR